jgi:hypothetical protein
VLLKRSAMVSNIMEAMVNALKVIQFIEYSNKKKCQDAQK